MGFITSQRGVRLVEGQIMVDHHQLVLLIIPQKIRIFPCSERPMTSSMVTVCIIFRALDRGFEQYIGQQRLRLLRLGQLCFQPGREGEQCFDFGDDTGLFGYGRERE